MFRLFWVCFWGLRVRVWSGVQDSGLGFGGFALGFRVLGFSGLGFAGFALGFSGLGFWDSGRASGFRLQRNSV